MPRIYRRSEWGARYANGFGSRPLPAKQDYLHHSMTSPPLVGTFAADCKAVRALEQIGQVRFGGGISYSFIIPPSGRIFEGVSVDRKGAHTGGHNSEGIGIVLLGDYSSKPPTAKQLASLIELRAWLKSTGALCDVRMLGHRDVKATACPGNAAYKMLAAISAGAIVRPYRATIKRPTDMRSKPGGAVMGRMEAGKVVTVLGRGVYGTLKVRHWLRTGYIPSSAIR